MDDDFQSIHNLLKTYFNLHPNPQLESRVTVTFATMYIYYRRAADYVVLSEASKSKIQQRLKDLFETESILDPPDCPELEIKHDDMDLVLFQKINRYLFEEFDCVLEKYLNMDMSDISNMISLLILPNRLSIPLSLAYTINTNTCDLPVPTIEWAVNLLEQLDYTIYQSFETSTPLYEWIKTIIDEYYEPKCLIVYLQLGWKAIVARYSELKTLQTTSSHYELLLGSFVDRLRNTMCYPARVSILEVPLNLKN